MTAPEPHGTVPVGGATRWDHRAHEPDARTSVAPPTEPGQPHVAACSEIRPGFCAALANGRQRCRKGTCDLQARDGEP